MGIDNRPPRWFSTFFIQSNGPVFTARPQRCGARAARPSRSRARPRAPISMQLCARERSAVRARASAAGPCAHARALVRTARPSARDRPLCTGGTLASSAYRVALR